MRSNAKIIGLGAAICLAVSCGGPKKSEESAHAPVDTSGKLVVEEVASPDLKPVGAILTNRDAGAARARIGGTLVSLDVREGDVVKEGEVIASIVDERRDLEASAGASQAAAAEARAVRARSDLKRAEKLFKEGLVPQAKLDDARAVARSAQAQLKAARAGSNALDEILNQGKVLAPADGRVTHAPIPQGAVVMPGDVIAEIATGRRVLRAELPEADAISLKEGDEISVARSGEAHERTARILQVYPAVQDGEIVVDIDATGFDDGFIGMRVPVLIPVGSTPMIVIPESYVLTRYGVDYVRLLRDNDTVIEAPVQRGRVSPGKGEAMIEILAGLQSGDIILPVAGTSREAS